MGVNTGAHVGCREDSPFLVGSPFGKRSMGHRYAYCIGHCVFSAWTPVELMSLSGQGLVRAYKWKVYDELGEDPEKSKLERLESAGELDGEPFVRTSQMTPRSSCGVFALPAVGRLPRLPYASSSHGTVLSLLRLFMTFMSRRSGLFWSRTGEPPSKSTLGTLVAHHEHV